MRRINISLSNELFKALQKYLQQHPRMSVMSVVEVALRQYLGEKRSRQARRTLKVTPSRRGSGRSDVSQKHDRYLAGILK
jgi:metal-responsive CopG/Arc/MetJ family transcriptional regulator